MSTVYQNLGVRFDFPENWQISEEHASGWPRSVTIQPPGTGFWLLQVHEAAEPRELTQHVLQTMRAEYPELEADSFLEMIEATEVVGFDLNFYCLDLLIGAQTRSLRLGPLTLLILCQAEDREFDKLEPVFRAMLISLLRHAREKR